jgi:hypothetical protein
MNFTKSGLLPIFAILLCVLFFTPSISKAEGRNWDNGVPEYKEAKVTIRKEGPKLIFSDSPENVTQNGVMYRDTVEGPVRLFFHHVNKTPFNQRLAVVFKRTTSRPARVTLKRVGISEPRQDWMRAGKEAEQRYYKAGQRNNSFRLIRTFDLLEHKDNPTVLNPGDLVTGIVDLNFDRPVEVSVMMIPVKADLSLSLEAYGILPPDNDGQHVLRGTFEEANRHVSLDEPFHTQGRAVWCIKLADDQLDPYIRGVDATTGRKVVNYGNYGVMYDVTMPTVGKHDTLVRFNPMGGEYAGAGIFGVAGEKDTRINIPSGSTYFGQVGFDGTTEVIGKIPAGKTGVLLFSPPGSSNLPVRIFLERKS